MRILLHSAATELPPLAATREKVCAAANTPGQPKNNGKRIYINKVIKRLTTSNAGKDVEKLEPSYIAEVTSNG